MHWIVGLAFAGQAEDLADLARRQGHVVDQAGVLSAAQGEQIALQAAALEQDLGVWVQVVTVPSLEDGDALDLGLALSQSLDLSASPEQNDLVALLVSDPERIEVLVGPGLRPVLTPAWEKEMMLRYVFPELERGLGAAALLRWMHKTDERLRSDAQSARMGASAPGFHAPPPPEPWDRRPLYGAAALLFGVGIGAVAYAFAQRRFCFNHTLPLPMFALSELDENSVLSPEQRLENGLHPERHEVLRCPECGAHRVLSRDRPRWL